MTTQNCWGGLSFSDGTATTLYEDITDASEDELHTKTVTASLGAFKGKTITHAWAGALTGPRYCAIKTAEGKYIPILFGNLGTMDGAGKMKLKKPYRVGDGDIIAIWTEA